MGKYDKHAGDVLCAMRFRIDIQICNTCCCRDGMMKRAVQSTMMSEQCRLGNCEPGHLKWEKSSSEGGYVTTCTKTRPDKNGNTDGKNWRPLHPLCAEPMVKSQDWDFTNKNGNTDGKNWRPLHPLCA